MSVDLHFEEKARAAGFSAVCGVDEAGAGPLMGPVYAAAVILPADCVIEGLDDSKKLTEKKREALFPVIFEKAVACAVASVDASEIDATDILSARMKAMQLAIDALEVPADYALIDGNRGTVLHLMDLLKQRGALCTQGHGGIVIENSSADPQLLDRSLELLEE